MATNPLASFLPTQTAPPQGLNFTLTPYSAPVTQQNVAAPTISQPNVFGAMSGSTPSVPLSVPQSTSQGNSGIQYTPSGGAIVPQSQATSLANAKSSTTPQYNADESTYNPAGLSQYVTNSYTTPSGAQVTTDMNGNITGTTPPPQYSINTEGSVPSDAMYGGTTMNDVMNGQSTYSGLVNALAQAQGYSPAYQQALAQSYGAQSGVASLQAQQAINSSQEALGQGAFQGSGGPTAAGMLNVMNAPLSAQEALTQQQETNANIALNTQQLARTGNIAAAQAELQYSPTGISGANAINQYQQLQQQYPNAGIPPYNPNGDPLQQYQNAYNMVATSPAYQSQFTQTYATPGGGTGVLNKLNLPDSLYQTNSNGTISLVSGAAATVGQSNAQIFSDTATQFATLSGTQGAIQRNVQTMTAFMNQYGLNQSGIPLITQIQDSAYSQTDKAGMIKALTADVGDLQSAYGGFLNARSGSSAGVNDTSQINLDINSLSPDQINQVGSQVQQDISNAQASAQSVLSTALAGLQTGTPQSSQPGASGITSPSSLTAGWNWSTMSGSTQ